MTKNTDIKFKWFTPKDISGSTPLDSTTEGKLNVRYMKVSQTLNYRNIFIYKIKGLPLVIVLPQEEKDFINN